MTITNFNFTELKAVAQSRTGKSTMVTMAESIFKTQGAKMAGFEVVFFNAYGVGTEEESVYITLVKDNRYAVDISIFPNGSLEIAEDVNQVGTGSGAKYEFRASLLECAGVEPIRKAPKLKVKLSVEEVAHYAEEFDMLEATVRNISKPTLTTQYNEIKATLAWSKDYALKLYKLYKAQGGKRVIPALEEVVVAEGWMPFDPNAQADAGEAGEEVVEEFKPTRAERKQAVQLKEAVLAERKKSEGKPFSKYKAEPLKAKIKDVVLLLRCVESGNYKPMFTTDLYINHGSEYCRLLELARK